MNNELVKATLRLFNAVQVEDKSRQFKSCPCYDRTIKHGYILDPAINDPKPELLNVIEDIVGISGEKANSAFHKSWTVIEDTPQEALWLQAMVHYMTTYGFEALGMYSESSVYIPHEKLEIPELKEDIPLTLVKAMDSAEVLEKIVDLGGSGIALKEETLKDIMSIVEINDYSNAFIDQIKNRELKSRLYSHYDIVPAEPVEFLRHVINELADESLLIKNEYLIDKIKDVGKIEIKHLDRLLKKAPDDLGSIFFRYKPLFLALKSISKNKTFFNQLRRKANKLHRPLPEDYLNSVTSRIKRDELDFSDLRKKLHGASVFRKIRLAYALKHRENPANSILYRVRNGTGWATEFEWDKSDAAGKALQIVLDSIAVDLAENVSDRVIYIPSYMHYTLPATEKQFVGSLPSGSHVSVPDDMIVGIHWFNNKGYRVDLDLSAMSALGKIGWNSYYKSHDKDVLFSGDVTDARRPKGASELFYMKKGCTCSQLMMVNYFNHDPDQPVPTKILVASESPKKFGSNYMVDPNNILAVANVDIAKKQSTLGLMANVGGENRFYFSNVNIGKANVSSTNACSDHVREYLTNSLVNSIDLKEMFERAGATVTGKKPTDLDFINLSPENLDKTTIIDLLKKGKAPQ